MWCPTTTASNATSDNKKKEEVELDDCSCSSGSGSGESVSSVAAAEAVTPKQQQQLQQKQNTFETNSKKPSLQFGGNLSSATTPTTTAAAAAATYTDIDHDQEGQAKYQQQQQQKEREFGTETGVDSGFISGPQTTELDPDQQDIFSKDNSQQPSTSAFASASANASIEAANSGVHKYNIRSTRSVDKQQQKKAQQKEVLDSGCIDVEDFNDDDDADHSEELVEQQKNPNESTTSETQPTADNSAQMILKQNVDAGMSEWFCNLSLQTEASDPSQMQNSQPSISLNNLNGTGRKVNSTPSNSTTTTTTTNKQTASQQQLQQQPTQSAENTVNNTVTTAAWEQFYQQNDDGDTPLHLACISGYVDVVAALIRMAPHPCLFNIQNDEAQTALHLAALTAQPKILRMLLIAGAEPTIRDRHGNTALHLACISGEEQCVRALIIPISASEKNEAHRQYGHRSSDKTVSYLSCARLPSDLEIRNYDGERCVHLAAQAGHIDILRILVLYGADINAREGKSGRTPLHIAIEGCNEDLANFLLDECQKLNLETATYAGLTAYQVACILNKSQMQNILERRGAEPLTPPDSDYDYDSSDIEDLDDSKTYDRFGDPSYFTTNYSGSNPMTVA